MAKWLVTQPGRSLAQARYQRWLEGAGLTLEWASPDHSEVTPGKYAGLLLTGGLDVDPTYYGESPHPKTSVDPRQRDKLEINLISTFLDAGKPVFGICRGIQILNVALGGGLIQHLPDYFRSRKEPLERHSIRAGEDSFHALVWTAETDLTRAMEGVTTVNSAHHQAIDPLRVGKGLRIVAVSPMGVIEAIEGDGLGAPVYAVQWHPERIPGPDDPARIGVLRLMQKLE
ncbi:MAG: gamma-glutamyl-gamma-aminobutyrate hydrolase family protein [bacterium JZ-2024 1]